jgi:hypothetical protein
MRSRISIHSSDPKRDAERYRQILAERLQDFFVFVNGSHVEVRIRPFSLAHTTFHPFKSVSSADFRVAPQTDSVLVDYEIRLTELAWTLGAFGLVSSIWAWSIKATLWNVVAPPGFMAFTFALNWFSARIGVRRFLRLAGTELAGSVSGVRDEAG